MNNYLIKESTPYPYEFDFEHTALVVIDMQKDFLEAGGFAEELGNSLQHIRRPIQPIADLLALFRFHKGTVFHTRECHLPDLSDCPPSKLKRSKQQGAEIGRSGKMGRLLIKGEEGNQIINEVKPLPGEPVIDKPGKGAFYKTNFEKQLFDRNIQQLIITGVTTHVCVHSTLREANDRGFDCLVVEDATAAFDKEDHQSALHMVSQQGGIFGWTAASQHIIQSVTREERNRSIQNV
ncbi:cysteine hydrolase family protein [Sinobaca sp. H24]|uniref:cysteine hydrolase family protein n=1 Tax=Sinobaca sp. H24 TaxID=2923376 RepID=UPI00207982FB|nr:isochorismatase family cysteine hydrolase [Sinobaca sp. H24]